MSDVALLLLITLAGLLWLESRRVQEIAVAHCRRACERAGMQFLDDIAPVWRVRLARDDAGALRLRRIFTFEYSTPFGERRSGSIVMLGRKPVALELEGRLQVEGSEADRFYP